MFGTRLPDCSKLAINWKKDNDVTIFRHDVTVSFFWHCFISLMKFSYWSKCHINIITGSGVMTIFIYKGLTRKLEIGNTPVWVLPNIWRLGKVGYIKVSTNLLIKCGWMLQNARVTAFTVSELLRENKQGNKITPHPD